MMASTIKNDFVERQMTVLTVMTARTRVRCDRPLYIVSEQNASC